MLTLARYFVAVYGIATGAVSPRHCFYLVPVAAEDSNRPEERLSF